MKIETTKKHKKPNFISLNNKNGKRRKKEENEFFTGKIPKENIKKFVKRRKQKKSYFHNRLEKQNRLLVVK